MPGFRAAKVTWSGRFFPNRCLRFPLRLDLVTFRPAERLFLRRLIKLRFFWPVPKAPFFLFPMAFYRFLRLAPVRRSPPPPPQRPSRKALRPIFVHAVVSPQRALSRAICLVLVSQTLSSGTSSTTMAWDTAWFYRVFSSAGSS